MKKTLLFVTAVAFALLRARTRQKRILHVKGFTCYSDFSEQSTVTAKALAFLVQFKPSIIVWDGDGHAHDSFTSVIERYLLDSSAAVTIFVPSVAEAAERLQMWKERLRDRFVHVRETMVRPSGAKGDFLDADYVQHGLKALEQTRARSVLVLGVGSCVAAELQSSAYLQAYVIDVERQHPTKGSESVRTYFSKLPANVHLL